ncbi:hypothetical protein CRD64_11405, partial [Streptococcus pneumoniae]|uniref:thioredoxin family protein n=1 Tax=Streptococcus pneumoniae TaxID=1313 RepID=UPI000BE71980
MEEHPDLMDQFLTNGGRSVPIVIIADKEAFQSWYDQFTWQNTEDAQFFESLNNRDDLRCLILAADWCGDVVRDVPVVFHLMETAGIPTEVFIMEEHPDLMDQFLTNGGRSVPIVIIAD